MRQFRQYTFYITAGLTTLAFAAAGLAKLAGVEALHVSFAAMGLPLWFGYFIGLCELSGAIGIWFKKLSVYAAGGLLLIMGGAIYYHVALEVPANAIAACVLSVFLINILFYRLKK